MKIVNKNMYISRGQVDGFVASDWNKTGEPVILPPTTKKSIHAIANITAVNNEYRYNFFVDTVFSEIEFSKHVNSIYVYNGGEGQKVVVNGERISNVKAEAIALTDDAYIKRIAFDNKEVHDDGVLAIGVFTIRAGEYDSIINQIAMNLMDHMLDDNTVFGFNKFTDYNIVTAENTTDLALDMIELYRQGNIRVGRVGNNFYHLNHNNDLLPYSFEFVVPLTYDDTNFDARQYTYDITVYQGIPKRIINSHEFPLDTITWKLQLVAPHKFTIGDSHNA